MSNSYFDKDKPITPLEEKFWKYHAENLRIYDLYKYFAFELINAGCRVLSSDAILHRVRWETALRAKNDKFKINNNYTAYYARLFITHHPQYEHMFERRKLKNGEEE